MRTAIERCELDIVQASAASILCSAAVLAGGEELQRAHRQELQRSCVCM